MIVVEILVGIIVAFVVLAGLASVGAPLANAFAERLKMKFKELEPSEVRQMNTRIAALEEEIRSLKTQLSGVQETADYAVRMIKIEKSAVR